MVALNEADRHDFSGEWEDAHEGYREAMYAQQAVNVAAALRLVASLPENERTKSTFVRLLVELKEAFG